MRAEPEEKSIIRDVPASRQDDDPGKGQNNYRIGRTTRTDPASEVRPGGTGGGKASKSKWKKVKKKRGSFSSCTSLWSPSTATAPEPLCSQCLRPSSKDSVWSLVSLSRSSMFIRVFHSTATAPSVRAACGSPPAIRLNRCSNSRMVNGTSLNSASLAPRPLASSVYVHVP